MADSEKHQDRPFVDIIATFSKIWWSVVGNLEFVYVNYCTCTHAQNKQFKKRLKVWALVIAVKTNSHENQNQEGYAIRYLILYSRIADDSHNIHAHHGTPYTVW